MGSVVAEGVEMTDEIARLRSLIRRLRDDQYVPSVSVSTLRSMFEAINENRKAGVVPNSQQMVQQCSMPSNNGLSRSIEALREYMLCRTRLGALELNEGRCHCADFHTCDHCTEWQELNLESRRLMNLWGDNWATLLWSYQEEVSAALCEEARYDHS